MVILFSSQSKLTSHAPDNISAAISLDTYSHNALLSLFLCLFSIIYLIIFEIANENIKANINSTG